MQSEQSGVHRIGQVVKIILAVIGGITVALVLLAAALVYELNYAVRTVDTSTSPDGRLTLELQAVGEPLFFSSADARLVLRLDRYEISRMDTSIADDGVQVRADSWQVSWNDTGAEVRLMGSEQYDELVTMGFDGSVTTRQTNERYGKPQETQTPTEVDGGPVTTEGMRQQADETDTAYKAVYDAMLKSQGYGFQVTYNARGDEQIVLSQDSESVVLLVYDRDSANGACTLLALESCPVEDCGSWSIDEATLLDEYAYAHDTGEVIASGKTSWSDAGTQAFRGATGE